jgi:hypothetical protein
MSTASSRGVRGATASKCSGSSTAADVSGRMIAGASGLSFA